MFFTFRHHCCEVIRQELPILLRILSDSKSSRKEFWARKGAGTSKPYEIIFYIFQSSIASKDIEIGPLSTPKWAKMYTSKANVARNRQIRTTKSTEYKTYEQTDPILTPTTWTEKTTTLTKRKTPTTLKMTGSTMAAKTTPKTIPTTTATMTKTKSYISYKQSKLNPITTFALTKLTEKTTTLTKRKTPTTLKMTGSTMAAKTTPKETPTERYISYKQANSNPITTSAFTKLTEKTISLTETTTATTPLTMTKTTMMESKTITIFTNYMSSEQENKVQPTSIRATTTWTEKPIPTTITTTKSTMTMTRTTTKTRIQSKTTTSPSVPGVIIVLRNTTTGNIIESGSIVKTRQFAETNQHFKYDIDCQVDNINFTCK